MEWSIPLRRVRAADFGSRPSRRPRRHRAGRPGRWQRAVSRPPAGSRLVDRTPAARRERLWIPPCSLLSGSSRTGMGGRAGRPAPFARRCTTAFSGEQRSDGVLGPGTARTVGLRPITALLAVASVAALRVPFFSCTAVRAPRGGAHPSGSTPSASLRQGPERSLNSPFGVSILVALLRHHERSLGRGLSADAPRHRLRRPDASQPARCGSPSPTRPDGPTPLTGPGSRSDGAIHPNGAPSVLSVR